MGASMRYLSQRYSMPYRKVSGLLTDAAVQKNREKEWLTNRMLSYTISH